MLHWFLSLSTRVPVPSMHSNGLSLSVPRIPFGSAVARHTGSLLSDGNPVYSSAEFLNMMTVSTGYPEQTRAPIQTYHTGPLRVPHHVGFNIWLPRGSSGWSQSSGQDIAVARSRPCPS